MRTILLLILLLGYWNLPAQQPGQKPIGTPTDKKFLAKPGSSRLLAEACNNNIDDDGNGLKDCEDYSCYYSSNTVCSCAPIDVVWIGDEDGDLFWVNHQTGVETYVGHMGMSMTDITWSPDGKLYGVDWIGNSIWQIDPATAQTTLVSSIPGYDFSNALTSDGNGNLYLASRFASGSTPMQIIKLNLSTGAITVVADLSAAGLMSAGDLAFYNGGLYLACTNNNLANINVTTGFISTTPILGLAPGANIYGIVIKSDGTVYLSDANKLYKLNIATMQASLYYTCVLQGIYIWGMASFNDYCLAPVCRANVTISIQSNQPYCSDPGVQLRAEGTGLNGTGFYKWTLPDGTNLVTQNITATKSGTYFVRYATAPDTCGWTDTLFLQITQLPEAKLGADTVLCTGTAITFIPSDTAGITSYLWQNGATDPQLLITQPGLYWIETANACGASRDSIIVDEKTFAKVELGQGRELCQYDTLHIGNLLDDPDYKYTWSDNSTGKSLVIPAFGKYWVDVKNICGKVSDTIIITKKIDGCDCFIYVPTGFTPNSDGKNDLMKTFSNCGITGELSIYNRWGQLVFQTKDLKTGWNGIYNSIPQTTGVYIYQVKYAYVLRPGSFFKKGTFVLIR